jgi:hypothetical protein
MRLLDTRAARDGETQQHIINREQDLDDCKGQKF